MRTVIREAASGVAVEDQDNCWEKDILRKGAKVTDKKEMIGQKLY